MKRYVTILLIMIPLIAIAEPQRDSAIASLESLPADTLISETSAKSMAENSVTSDSLHSPSGEKHGQTVFCRFNGTKPKYPALTWGMLALGTVLSGVTYYHHEEAINCYTEYLAATEDSEILRYKEAAEYNDQKAEKLSYASAACFISATINYMIRIKTPSSKITNLSEIKNNGDPILQTVMHDGKYGLALSWGVWQ